MEDTKTTKEIYNSVINTCSASDEFGELMKQKWIKIKEEVTK